MWKTEACHPALVEPKEANGGTFVILQHGPRDSLSAPLTASSPVLSQNALKAQLSDLPITLGMGC